MAVLEDIFSGVGKAVKGAADFTFGPGRNTKLREDFEIMRGNFDPAVKEAAAQRIVQSVDPGTIEKMRTQSQKAYQPTGQDLLTPAQQKESAQVKGGIKPSADAATRAAARAKSPTTFDKLDAETKKRKSAQAFFDTATDEEGKFLNPKDQERYEKAMLEISPDQTPESEQPQTNVGKRKAEMDRTSAFVGPPAPGPGPAPFEGPPVGRAEQAGNFAPPEVSRQFQGQVSGDPRYADFFSGGTNPFEVNMQSTDPKPFAELGMTSAGDQEEFTKLQKMIPDADLRQEINKSPQEYKKLFDAIRKGRVTSKRAVELIKESMGQ